MCDKKLKSYYLLQSIFLRLSTFSVILNNNYKTDLRKFICLILYNYTKIYYQFLKTNDTFHITQ